ncbi:hypothetical protein AALO_G00021420 [Alosa alosa]|uniref:Radial spoke head component 4A n=1 Tax=Alosa alosa TaxID=278164 RepID=A0AAV6HBN7_9TELE|nr:radial spoke head protein 6 homolog A [Alosa alosa]KAG5283959.1 hypothetical protein AALO_G00021420 [Alosa alosa]
MKTSEDAKDKNTEQMAACLKSFMLKSSTKTNLNLYDHLARLLHKILDERPENAVDVLEDMSRDLKRSLMQEKQSALRDTPFSSAQQDLAELQRILFARQPSDDGDHDEELVEAPIPNVAELAFYLEQAGVGMEKEEMQRIFLALKHLVDTQPLQHCRLWGKILGTEANYLVAEVELREGEEEEEEEGAEEAADEEEKEPRDKEEGEVVEVVDPLPKSAHKPPSVVPKEENRTGTNKYTYFVCQEPGLPWVKLPSVTPAQISAARQIRKFFTGRLNTPIISYPPFPGNEANYLRAQIARISASTHVSPLGYFQFGEEEGDDDDDGARANFEENPDFEGIPVTEMAESLSTWVHHVQHILTQGRCVWVNLAEKPADEFDEDEEEEQREEEPDEPEPEVGPPLLTPLSEDAEVNSTSPWTSGLSSALIPQFAIATLRSNLWPGAYAYACGKKFDSIYIGWGMKSADSKYGYSPTMVPGPQAEYTSGAEVTESLDPTLEEELALKAALEEQRAAQEEAEGLDDEEEDD